MSIDRQRSNQAANPLPVLHIIDGATVTVENASSIARMVRFFGTPFVSAWHHRDLIAAILRRELHERFKGSVAGWVWAIFAPLLSLATYTLVFSGTVKLANETQMGSQADYALFIFGGIIAFNLFTEMAYRAPSLLHEYSHFIKQTMFPAEMLPIISTMRATFYASIGLVVMLLAQLALGGTLYWTTLLLPLWLVPFLAFLIGFTWLLSAMGAFTRDTAYFMMTIAPLLMFITPVFFSLDTMSGNIRLMMYLNPLTGFIEIIRDIVVFGGLPRLPVCLWIVAYSGSMFWLGYWFFGRQRDRIADVI
jgi:lipopolysaccharide transport system permease protein